MVNKRQDTLVGNRAEITILANAILANAGWGHEQSMNGGSSKGKKSGKKMRFPRRNSLNFPVKAPSSRPEPEEEDPFTDLVKQRCNAPKAPIPISSEIKKALAVLGTASDDNLSVSATSAMSNSTASTSGEDEVLKVNESSKDDNAISTPVPQRKKALQIPMAKRKTLGGSAATNDSPTSVTESLDISPVPITKDIKKTKVKKTRSRDSSSKSFTKKKRDSSEKSASKIRDPAEKSKKKNSSKKKKSKKKVHFRQTCTMRRTLSRKDMTTKEIRKAWLSWEEYHRMQIRDEILADRVDAGRCKPGTCIRGLESKIEESAMKKLKLRMTGFEDVLLEQERQWDQAGDDHKFQYDFESISDAYEMISKKALLVAQEVARLDRLEAEKIMASSNPFKSKGLRSRFTRRRSWA